MTQRSPLTHWGREDWCNLADRLVTTAMSHATPGHGRIVMPGEPGGLGPDIDGLEELASWWAGGVAAGVDQRAEDRWLRPSEHWQAVVEACSLALTLHFTKPWIWDQLSQRTQEQAVEWFQDVRNPEIPDNNWIWFQVIVETFLRGLGADWDEALVREHLERHEDWYRTDGWISDGPRRCYDHYVGWAMETLPALWTLMDPTWDLSRDFATVHGPRLRRYLEDSPSSSELIWTATEVPLLSSRDVASSTGGAPARRCGPEPSWVFLQCPPGLTRRICSGTVRHFLDRGAGADGILTMGWFGEFRPMAQFYFGVGSPYWASKGMLGLALPADHLVWAAEEEALPVEKEDTHRLISTPGWMVSGTSADGVVRVLNIGTDGENEADLVSEAPLYTSLGFSTVTAPAQAGEWTLQPVANVVALRDAKGRVSCRSGQHVDRLEQLGDVLVGQSSWQVHWIKVEPDSQVGYGARGESDLGPRIVCAQVCHQGIEVRCAWFDEDVPVASVVVAGLAD